MKTNISALMNLISEEEKEINTLTYDIKNFALNLSVQELNGNETIIEDNKETFKEDLKEIEDKTKELTKLKGILYQKNNEFKLTDGRSIQTAIVDNANLRKLKQTYENLLQYKNSKKRVTEVNNSYFETKTLNFDPKDLKQKLKKVDQKIRQTDFEISKLNSIEFTI